jgi:hypothetical protein
VVKKQTIHPAKYLTGGVAPPGDKSISHRYAMLSALAEGTTELRHFAAAADCHSTLDCMSALGASVKIDNDLVKVTGRGAEGLKGSRHHNPPAHRNSRWPEIHFQIERRFLHPKAPDGPRRFAPAPDGRRHSRPRR